MENLSSSLKRLLPEVRLVAGQNFAWSYGNQTITYDSQEISNNFVSARWSILHEAGHALLKHQDYNLDIDLLLMEVAAWDQAKNIARKLKIKIDEDHIQDCLDSYRDWLHQRSTCPNCQTVSLQINKRTYRCYNCEQQWQVSTSRFCRPYRRSKSFES